MTLIEMIGVLTVVAILAAVSLAFTVRHLDQIASDKETQNLRALGTALENSILRTRHIPDATDWASAVATEAGMNVDAVTNNFRNCQRVLLFDAGGWLSTNVPYTQTMQSATNITSPPASARMMLVSTISGSLPVSSGVLTTPYFSDLWNCADSTVPSAPPWSTWTGTRPGDVKVHRINLSPLFARLVLSTYFSASPGQYAVDATPGSPPYLAAPYSNAVSGYYLKGTAIQLYTNLPTPASTPQLTHILNEDSSFVFENGVWKTSLTGGRTLGAGSSMGIVAAFLAARPNTNAQYYSPAFSNQQQVLIVGAFINYMSNYNRWVYTNMSNTDRNSLQSYLQGTSQSRLMDLVHGLYTKAADGRDHFPTNGVIWPPL